jgi:hydroxymethylglutaryl-CoA lyase
MADTASVLQQFDWRQRTSRLLAIVANLRGGKEAVAQEAIHYLGFPFSISETFQQRNTNKSIPEALNTLESIKNICEKTGKKLVTYISMGFGNPYGDPYDVSRVGQFVDILVTLGSDVISLADTIGVSNATDINNLFSSLRKEFPDTELGVHLHSTPQTAGEKIHAAYQAGCRRFDGAIRGYGGCPMAKDELVGNIATEAIISYLDEHAVPMAIDRHMFAAAQALADTIFPAH